MAFYQSFETARDFNLLSFMETIKTFDQSATVADRRELDGRVVLGKATAWTAPQIANAQSLLDTAVENSPQLSAQQAVDRFPIEMKALALTLLDQINVLRSKLAPPLPAITPAQALQAIRDKAATL